MKLLIVEDEWLTREGIINYIPWEDLGIREIRESEDGSEGLKEALRYQPDIVLADVRMPHMDGLTMAFEIQKAIPYCRFIFMSGFSDKQYLKSAIALSAVDYIDKPVEPEEIIATVKKAAVQLRKEKRSILLEAKFQEELKDSSENGMEQDNWQSQQELARKLEQYIDEHYLDNELTLTVMADQFQVSKQYLCLVYKKEMGRTISQSIIAKRIVWAEEYIRQCDKVKVKEIALKAGFSDSNYFIKIFKKGTGLTPLEYKSSL